MKHSSAITKDFDIEEVLDSTPGNTSYAGSVDLSQSSSADTDSAIRLMNAETRRDIARFICFIILLVVVLAFLAFFFRGDDRILYVVLTLVGNVIAGVIGYFLATK